MRPPSPAPDPGTWEGGAQLDSLIDHLFRREAGRMVAALTRVFGTRNLELAEDVVQDALVQAMRHWPFQGIPKNPAGWLYQVARRRAIDVLRRQQALTPVPLSEEQTGGRAMPVEAVVEQLFLEEDIPDDTLRMMFTCCHPALTLESQVALTLNLLCGFSSGEIAHALLASEAAVQKRLARAKQQIRDARAAVEVPSGPDLAARLQAVVAVLYLMFNEGYSSSSAESPIRRDVCGEAMRLGRLLLEHPAGHHPDVAALIALMCFHAARFDARLDDEGNLLTLKEQDRSKWDRDLIRQGFRHLEQSAASGEIGPLHLEAAIAAVHCLADAYEATDWTSIVRLYDQLMELKPSPVIALNRAIALAELEGPRAGLAAVEDISDRRILEDYHLYAATLGELHLRLGEFDEAARHFERAMAMTASPAEQRHLARKLARCRSAVQPAEGSRT